MAPLGRGADSAKTRIWTRGSQTIVAFVHAAKKRRRALVVASVVAVIVAVVGTFGVLRYLKAQAATKVVESYSALSRCLLGELDAGDRASRRFRSIQLSAVTQADRKRVPSEGDPWPDRCRSHAHALAESLEASTVVDSEDGRALLTSTKELATALEAKDAYFVDLSDALDGTFDTARKLGLALTDVPDVPAPEAATEALTLDDLAGTTPIAEKTVDLSRLRLEPARADAARLLVDSPDGGKLCRVTGETAECHGLPAASADGDRLELRGTADDGAWALLFESKEGQVFAISEDGPVVDEAGVAGHEAADGTIHVVTADDGRLSLIRIAGKDRARQSVRLPFGLSLEDPSAGVHMFWRHVVALGTTKDEHRLVTARLDGTRLPSMSEIITLEGGHVDNPSVDGCRSSKATVVRMGDATTARLSFWLGERWTAPVEADLGAGVEGAGTLSCHGTEAAITRYEPGRGDTELSAAIAQQRCTPRACSGTRMTLGDLLAGETGLAPQALIAAVGLQSKLLVVWAAGQRGGLRMRLAPASEVASAPDVVIYDDLVSEGEVRKTSTLVDMRLVPTERFAVLLLDTTAGLYALRIEPTGKIEPLSFAAR